MILFRASFDANDEIRWAPKVITLEQFVILIRNASDEVGYLTKCSEASLCITLFIKFDDTLVLICNFA